MADGTEKLSGGISGDAGCVILFTPEKAGALLGGVVLIYPNSLITEWLIDIDRWPYPVGQRDLLYELMKIPEISAAFGRALQGVFSSELQVTTHNGGYWVSVFPMGKPVGMVKIVGIPIEMPVTEKVCMGHLNRVDTGLEEFAKMCK